MNLEKKELQKKQPRGFKFSSSSHNSKHYHQHGRPPSHELMTQTTVAIGADRMKQQRQQQQKPQRQKQQQQKQQTMSIVSVS